MGCHCHSHHRNQFTLPGNPQVGHCHSLRQCPPANPTFCFHQPRSTVKSSTCHTVGGTGTSTASYEDFRTRIQTSQARSTSPGATPPNLLSVLLGRQAGKSMERRRNVGGTVK